MIAAVTLSAATVAHAENTLPPADVATIHQGGGGLPQAYDGTGVTIGFLDYGFDPNHVTFLNRDLSGSRVKAFYLWSGGAYQLTDLSAATTDYAGDYHGTHVAGIAAGGYNGACRYNDGTGVKTYDHMPFAGVAPNADIVMVGAGGDLNSSRISAGMDKLVSEYGGSHPGPMVINMSFGDIKGSHSGSGEGVTGREAIGYAKDGVIICVASGNEGSMQTAFTADGKENAKDFCVGLPFSNSIVDYNVYTTPRLKEGVDAGSTLTSAMVEPLQLDFIVYDTTTGKVCFSQSIYEISRLAQKAVGGSSTAMLGCQVNSDFDTWFSADSYIQVYSSGLIDVQRDNWSGVTTLRERSEWSFSFRTQLKGGESSRYKPGLFISCRKGETAFGYSTSAALPSHGVGSSTSTDGTQSYPEWAAGSADGAMSSIATSDEVICVGACSATERTGYLDGTSYASRYKPGEIWPMSSYGANTFTGERLPHVVAPGYSIVSAMNSYYSDPYNKFCASADYNGKTHNWKDASGTSMATPFVAGTIALWMQAAPGLTTADVKEVFRNTNVYPDDIAALPETDARRLQWGGGMIQPLEGLKYILRNNIGSGINDISGDARILVEQYDTEIRVCVPGETGLTVRMYSICGVFAASSAASGDEVAVSTSGLGKNIYILEIQGNNSRYVRKIVLR